MGCMWLYDNWGTEARRSPRGIMMTAWSIFMIGVGSFLMVAGTYSPIVRIIKMQRVDSGSGAWSCADNSHST
ncbi:hypothetical protein AAL_07034 [Moelleriella libera RCEF 2490]|uniref:Uncharacterized protein n=1 Tax=Moelleriella libera RCEF 2490 TaxID=1081109 RepID=A0A167Y388_9HYPO|nr:hypothetical protein AAL_07034 [Moelleriella libera RCEF 2490]